MYVIVGGTGHVGAAAASALAHAGEEVVIVSRSDRDRSRWADRGVELAVADVHDVDALRSVLRGARRAFLVNPPADTSTDIDVEERATASSIAAGVRGSGLEKVVVESTYGAQPGGGPCGDLTVLYEFEQQVLATGVPAAINRAAYHFSNWDPSLDEARDTGRLHSMFPATATLPMVAPADLGRAAARRLREPPQITGTFYVEGPRHYSPNDVANRFAVALGRDVEVQVIPPAGRFEAYKGLGFSDAAAASYERMTAVSIDDGFELPAQPERGTTTLETYIAQLVA